MTHPLWGPLIALLPPADAVWPRERQIAWLRSAAAISNLLYAKSRDEWIDVDDSGQVFRLPRNPIEADGK